MEYETKKEIIPDLIIVFLGCLVLFCCFIFKRSKNRSKEESKKFAELSGVIRVIIALSAASVNTSLPGFVELETQKESSDTLWPKIKAGEALAVFVIVYLFDPIG